ncbi:MAG: type II toxin-antitoxin system HicB family antitoxin [Thermomicrobia bacterium]|nr:type II toxin-antitoxin system HicB family antitoxin [Thermomicrobia bacterium]MCA1725504.1 type II toxin-antitoxin system HicB family antitoxin [Thermomicrobia bacterium]
MLTEYLHAAMCHACYKQYDDGTTFGSIDLPGFEGVWANEATQEETERELRSVLEDWLLLGLQLRHHLPVVDDIDVNALVAA